jgi:hypothetical protein
MAGLAARSAMSKYFIYRMMMMMMMMVVSGEGDEEGRLKLPARIGSICER